MISIDPKWDTGKLRRESDVLADLINIAELSAAERDAIVVMAVGLVEKIRRHTQPGLMEVFLAQYGLSTDEGVALMCLAEALLRVPDPETIDALIEDKITSSDWSSHLGQSTSPLVNASTWGLLLTGRVLDEGHGISGTLRGLIRRLGEPVIRNAVSTAIRQMGRQFVLGETIDGAMKRAAHREGQGFTYSYDMLGEAAMTAADARRYAEAYAHAIAHIAKAAKGGSIADNPGISVKLSALHPRYEVAKTERVMSELVPVLKGLARRAAIAGIGFNIDAEEADRLGLSLNVIEATLAEPSLKGWDGFGVVVQAYSRRASTVIDGLYDMAKRYDRRLMVRLVKGAYWDTEIKHAQVQGLDDFPVFTQKAATDVSFIANARTLLNMTDRIYPQFATHNAHSIAAILSMSEGLSKDAYEFQRLHGMGEALHDIIHAEHGTRCRIYAPVGAHRDLLAYLVRRLLENGANSSFVNQIVDEDVPAHQVAACPFAALDTALPLTFATGANLYQPERPNSFGFDLSNVFDLKTIEDARGQPDFLCIKPILAPKVRGAASLPIINPATGEKIGDVIEADLEDVDAALTSAKPWMVPAQERAAILNKTADRFEADFAEAFALLGLEAGKTLADALAELREAVDFLRYYAARADQLDGQARDVITCISPWNFPLAIFAGQVAAALVAGNAVLAKPAESTPAIAAWAVERFHRAGVPRTALQLLPGPGSVIGAALTTDARIKGVAFTGSTATARHIQNAMATHCDPGTPLIAETGGLNAMVVDSSALPEQAVRDIIASSFQSAGQRCSALRCLYLQDDIADHFITLLKGAMDELTLGDPWDIRTDVGPIITTHAADEIEAYVKRAEAEGRLLYRLKAPATGSFVAPALIKVGGIEEMETEIFGPVLHVATFRSQDLDRVIQSVNATGYGLTFGLHTRIDDRVQAVADAIKAGNIYANRNQIGAIVGSQPFGGEGLSGTGPKAGGPNYVQRFVQSPPKVTTPPSVQSHTDGLNFADVLSALKAASEQAPDIETTVLPGPTGELNRLRTVARPPVLCAGPGTALAEQQREEIEALGGKAMLADRISADDLTKLPEFGGVLWWGDDVTGRKYAKALANRSGPIIPLITSRPDKAHACLERHLCVDTTAAGGNTALFAD